MKRSWRSRTQVDVGDDGVVSLAGASLLTTTAQVLGLDRDLSKRLSGWTPVGATHDTGKIVLDLAVALAVGGDCPADIAVLRGQPRLFGLVASDSTVSRRVDLLAADVEESVAAIRAAFPIMCVSHRLLTSFLRSLPVSCCGQGKLACFPYWRTDKAEVKGARTTHR